MAQERNVRLAPIAMLDQAGHDFTKWFLRNFFGLNPDGSPMSLSKSRMYWQSSFPRAGFLCLWAYTPRLELQLTSG